MYGVPRRYSIARRYRRTAKGSEKMDPSANSKEMAGEKLLNKCFEKHELLDSLGVTLRICQQVAYICGSVPNFHQKRLAGQIAVGNIEDGFSVANMLKIVPLTVVDDEILVVNVRKAIAQTSEADGIKISAEVRNGVVYLEGQVNTPNEKCIVELEVRDLAGVWHVTSQVQIAGEI